MSSLKKCPHCGSDEIRWIQKGDDGYYECGACGYMGIHIEEEDRENNPDISW